MHVTPQSLFEMHPDSGGPTDDLDELDDEPKRPYNAESSVDSTIPRNRLCCLLPSMMMLCFFV